MSQNKYPLQDKTYVLNGLAMEVHRNLKPGLSEVLYKDAFQFELDQKGIIYEREKEYEVEYKGTNLKHKFYADFVVMNEIIIEVKAQKGIHELASSQVLNYLAISKCKVGLLYNFGESSLAIKRYVL